MNIYDVLFIFGLLSVISISLARIYNIISSGKVFNIGVSFMLFIGFLLSWLVCLVTVMIEPIVLYSVLFRICNLFLVVNIFMLLIDILMFWTLKSPVITSYGSEQKSFLPHAYNK